jgi:phosphatidylglycerol:prolipoprotein diacylglycerol transferase
MIAIGLFAALQYLLVKSKKAGITENNITDIVLYLIVSGLVGARLVYVLTNFQFYLSNPADIFKIWEGGLVFYGGLIGGIITLAVYTRVQKDADFWKTGDLLAPAISLAHVFGRIGCLFAGCCYGKPSLLPWAVKFSNPESLAPLNVCLHPTQIYESVGNLVIFLALDRFNKTEHKKGQTVFLYMFLYGILRFVVELFRGDDRGDRILFLSQGQLISIIMIVVALLVYFFYFRKEHDNN